MAILPLTFLATDMEVESICRVKTWFRIWYSMTLVCQVNWQFFYKSKSVAIDSVFLKVVLNYLGN